MTHQLTTKQQNALAEFRKAFQDLTDRQNLYIRGIFDAADLDPTLPWRMADDGTCLIAEPTDQNP